MGSQCEAVACGCVEYGDRISWLFDSLHTCLSLL